MSILGVDARKKIAELIKQIQEQSGGFGPPSAGYGDGKLYNGPEPVVGNTIKKVATFKPEIPFGTDIARKVVEGTENLGNQLVPPLELGPVKLTGSEQLDILLSGLLQKQRGEVEVPAAKKKAKVREPELSPVPTTVPKYKGPKLEDVEAEITPASDVKSFVDDFLAKYETDNGFLENEGRPFFEDPGQVGQPPPKLSRGALADLTVSNQLDTRINKLLEKRYSGALTEEEYKSELAWLKEERDLLLKKLGGRKNQWEDESYREFKRGNNGPIPSTIPPKAPTAPGTTVPDAVRRRLEAQGKIKPQPTVAPELTKSHIRDPYDDFLENYSTEPQINRAPEEAAKTAAQRERNASKMPQVYELEREFATHPDPEVRSDFAHVRENWLGTDDYLAQLKILQAEATPAYRAFAKRMEQEHWSNYNAPGPLAATNALEEARFKYVRGEIDLRTYEDMVDEARKLFDTPIPEPGPDPFNIEHDKLIEDHKSGKITDKQYFDSYLALKRKFKLA